MTARSLVLVFLAIAPVYAFADEDTASKAGAPTPAAELTETQRKALERSVSRSGLTSDVVAKLSPEQITSVLLEHHRSDKDEVPAVAIVVPVAMFAMILLIVVMALYVGFRRDRHRHETLRAMIDKEVPIPPELLSPPVRRSDLRRGLVFAGAGLGFAIAIAIIPNTNRAWALGAIPLLIGLGYLVAWRIEGQPTT